MPENSDIGIRHKGLKYELKDRRASEYALLATVFTALACFMAINEGPDLREKGLLGALCSFTGFSAGAVVILIAAMLYNAAGLTYKKALAAYERSGLSEKEADKDFERGTVVIIDDNHICIGEQRLFYMGVMGQPLALNYGQILWVYVKETGRKVTSGRDMGALIVEIVLCMSDTTLAMTCPEGAAQAVTEMISEKSGCPAGYSEALDRAYTQDPKSFVWKRHELPPPDIGERPGKDRK